MDTIHPNDPSAPQRRPVQNGPPPPSRTFIAQWGEYYLRENDLLYQMQMVVTENRDLEERVTALETEIRAQGAQITALEERVASGEQGARNCICNAMVGWLDQP